MSLWFRRSYESERQRVTNVGTGTLENAASLFLELLNRVLLPRRRSGNRLRGDVGIGSRAERVIVITAGLVLAPLSIWLLEAAIYLLTVTAWLTVVQRILFVRKQLLVSGGPNGIDER